MIKLIATDMDGTLLTSEKKLPPDFDDTLDMLESKNVRFVIASGRSYSALKVTFPNHIDRMEFICDNGAYIMIGGRLDKVSIIPRETVTRIISECRKLDGVTPVLCAMNGTYFDSCIPGLYEEISRFYMNFSQVDDLLKVNDDVFKIAVCDAHNPINNSLPVLSGVFGGTLSLAASGPMWMDIMNRGINKGAALKEIQSRLGISYEETMAFGDYFNDSELLKNAFYSYAMANAHPDMFGIARYKADTNDNFGVTKVIRDFFSMNNE